MSLPVGHDASRKVGSVLLDAETVDLIRVTPDVEQLVIAKDSDF